MELPFAVETPSDPVTNSLHQSESSSLVTASSQGSFMNSTSHLDSLNTPQDVVLPRYDRISTEPVNPKEPEVIDFTYVNVCETDADGANILIDHNHLNFAQNSQRGDVLSVLLSGADPLVVRIGYHLALHFNVPEQKLKQHFLSFLGGH
jgi:hypothetical protein